MDRSSRREGIYNDQHAFFWFPWSSQAKIPPGVYSAPPKLDGRRCLRQDGATAFAAGLYRSTAFQGSLLG
jgi:hypothetical protein